MNTIPSHVKSYYVTCWHLQYMYYMWFTTWLHQQCLCMITWYTSHSLQPLDPMPKWVSSFHPGQVWNSWVSIAHCLQRKSIYTVYSMWHAVHTNYIISRSSVTEDWVLSEKKLLPGCVSIPFYYWLHLLIASSHKWWLLLLSDMLPCHLQFPRSTFQKSNKQ